MEHSQWCPAASSQGLMKALLCALLNFQIQEYHAVAEINHNAAVYTTGIIMLKSSPFFPYKIDLPHITSYWKRQQKKLIKSSLSFSDLKQGRLRSLNEKST